ncbi:hypothetical protein DPX39_100021500 [Trypanosoma brucei equiperdum]|uniref:Uncharacterized protein n=1 Tax=Trypanosoma brucei equiperdum TaxID=630700 RepID=A0A3L6KZH9_9TRYP|nr:hypothetical protein DPX39_100021500 [Trypanosoma brucei equiperdum]
MFRQELRRRSVILFHDGLVPRRMIINEDPQERSRELALREKVAKKYKGLNISEFSGFSYGHFAMGGLATSAAFRAREASQGNAPNFGNLPQGERRVDWLMFFTGVVLVFVSSKIIIQRLFGGVSEDLALPLWIGSVDEQATYLLFTIQYDKSSRQRIKDEYLAERRINPFITFFPWLITRYPEYGRGVQFSRDVAFGTLREILSSGNQRSLLNLAGSTKDTLLRNDSPAHRVDYFLRRLGVVPMIQGVNSDSKAAAYAPPAIASNLQLMYGSEPEAIKTVLSVSPDERHGSVPFQ